MTTARAALLGMFAALAAPCAQAGHDAEDAATYSVKDGEIVRELRVWFHHGGKLRFQLTRSRGGDAAPRQLSGWAVAPAPGDSECDAEEGKFLGECWEVQGYFGKSGACWVNIRLEAEARHRATVHVADCAEARVFHSTAVYRTAP